MSIRFFSRSSIKTGVKSSDFWDGTAVIFNNTPPVTSGLTHWYDGTDSATMTLSSGNLSQWNNKSPASGGPNITQATGSKQPNFVSNVKNGRAAVQFTRANNDWIGSTSQPSSGSITHTICFAGMTNGTTGSPSGAQQSVGWGTSNYVGGQWCTAFTGNDDALGASRVNTGLAGNQSTAGVLSANNYSGIWYAQIATISGSAQTQAVNLTDTGTQNATASNVANNSEFFLGQGTNPWYGSFGWNGYMGDVLIYNRVLTAQEKTDMANWLMQKWGIS